jgi:hypothetical protein
MYFEVQQAKPVRTRAGIGGCALAYAVGGWGEESVPACKFDAGPLWVFALHVGCAAYTYMHHAGGDARRSCSTNAITGQRLLRSGFGGGWGRAGALTARCNVDV